PPDDSTSHGTGTQIDLPSEHSAHLCAEPPPGLGELTLLASFPSRNRVSFAHLIAATPSRAALKPTPPCRGTRDGSTLRDSLAVPSGSWSDPCCGSGKSPFFEESLMLRFGRVSLGAVALAALALSASLHAADPKYFPPDTEIVVSINVKQILGSELLKANKDKLEQFKEMIKSQLPGDAQAQKYLERMGFDPFKDLTSITIAMPPSTDPDALFVIVEGAFNQEKIQGVAERVAQEHGEVFKIGKVGKYKIYEISPEGEKKVFATLLNDNTMVACTSEGAVKAAINRATGGQRADLKKEITSLLQTTSPKQSLSFVTTGSALVKLAETAPVPNQQALQSLQSIEGISGAITINKDVQLQLGVSAKDAATAKDFAQKANFGLNMVRLLVNQKVQQDERLQPVADAVKTLRATSEGSALILRAEMSFENIQKLMQNFNPN